MTTDPAPRLRSKNLDDPDAVRPLGHGTGSYVELGKSVTIGRALLDPGWRWSVDVQPLVGTPSCRIHHIQLVIEGRLGIRLDSGDEGIFGPTTIVEIPPGHDAWVEGDEPALIFDLSGNSADFALPAPRTRTVLTMVMTDIVNSTQTAARVGDSAWKQQLAEHNRIVRRQLTRFGGREVNTTGDGFLAAFASAEGALRAALAIRDAVRAAGVEIRAGVQTGEVDVVDDGDIRGIAVHETARIMAAAEPGTVFASALSRALAGASGLGFVSTGTHALKGFDEPVELFRVEAAPA